MIRPQPFEGPRIGSSFADSPGDEGGARWVFQSPAGRVPVSTCVVDCQQPERTPFFYVKGFGHRFEARPNLIPLSAFSNLHAVLRRGTQ